MVTFDNFCAISLATALERHSANQFLKTATTSTLSNRNCFKLLVKTITASPICTVSVIQILDDADVAFRLSGAEWRTFYPRPPCSPTSRTASTCFDDLASGCRTCGWATRAAGYRAAILCFGTFPTWLDCD